MFDTSLIIFSLWKRVRDFIKFFLHFILLLSVRRMTRFSPYKLSAVIFTFNKQDTISGLPKRGSMRLSALLRKRFDAYFLWIVKRFKLRR